MKGGEYDIPCVSGTYTVKTLDEERSGQSITITVPGDKAEVAVPTLDPKQPVLSLL